MAVDLVELSIDMLTLLEVLRVAIIVRIRFWRFQVTLNLSLQDGGQPGEAVLRIIAYGSDSLLCDQGFVLRRQALPIDCVLFEQSRCRCRHEWEGRVLLG